MIVTAIKLKSRLANWREWEPNPILLKELRQAVRSQLLTGMLLSLLVVHFMVSIGFLAAEDSQLGLDVVRAFLVVLAAICLVFIPLYTGIRLALERQQADLMFVTALSAQKVVQGKFFSSVYLTVLFFSECLPFMTFATLLRGVDLPTIFFVLILLFTVVCLAILAAIALAAVPFNIIVKAVLGLMFTGALFVVSGVLLLFFFELVRSGVASLGASGEFWIGFFVLLAVASFGAIVLYGVAVSFIVPSYRPRGLYNEGVQPQPA